MDRDTWPATVHGISESDMTWATDTFLFIDYNNIHEYNKLQYVKTLLINSESR